MTARERVVMRARACVGVRFRPQGRDPTLGLDCVGVAGVALGARFAADHPMRCADAARVARAAAELGLARVAEPGAGDVALFRAGPGQLHLGVLTGSGVIHADAVARRVVERPGAPPWPLVAAWRTGED